MLEMFRRDQFRQDLLVERQRARGGRGAARGARRAAHRGARCGTGPPRADDCGAPILWGTRFAPRAVASSAPREPPVAGKAPHDRAWRPDTGVARPLPALVARRSRRTRSNCLECGERLPGEPGAVGVLASGWQRRPSWYPGDSMWPALGLLLVAVVATSLAVALGAKGSTGDHTIVATSANPARPRPPHRNRRERRRRPGRCRRRPSRQCPRRRRRRSRGQPREAFRPGQRARPATPSSSARSRPRPVARRRSTAPSGRERPASPRPASSTRPTTRASTPATTSSSRDLRTPAEALGGVSTAHSHGIQRRLSEAGHALGVSSEPARAPR